MYSIDETFDIGNQFGVGCYVDEQNCEREWVYSDKTRECCVKSKGYSYTIQKNRHKQ